MIIRPMPNWFRMLFVWSGSAPQSMIPQLIFAASPTRKSGAAQPAQVRM